METYTSNDYRLYHHGILGMKWGQRNGPPYPLTSKTRSADENDARRKRAGKNVSEDYVRAHTKKSVKELSDKELREILNRINMEQQYNRLHPGTVEKGKRSCNNALKTARNIIGAYGTFKALKIVFQEIGSHLSFDEVVEIGEDVLGN